MFLVQDLRPIRVIGGSGFVKFLNILEPKLKLISRNTLKQNYLKPIYIQLKNKVKTIILNNCVSFNMTTDYWTSSVQNNAYITFTLHMISKEFINYNFVL